MSHTRSDSDNQKVPTHDDSLPDVNIKVKKFFLSRLSRNGQKEILMTASTEKYTIQKRISLKLEHPDHFGLILLNYKGPKSDNFFPRNFTIKVKEILLGKYITEITDSNLKGQQRKYLIDGIRHIITKKESDCRYVCTKAIEDKYTDVLQMKLEIINTNNLFRRFALHLDDGSSILLCRAIRNKDMETIKVLLNFKFNINARNEVGSTPLHVAVNSEMSDVVDLLISKSVNVNIFDNYHQVPLHYAIEKNYLKIVDSLLRNQVNLNARDQFGRTPLFFAVDAGNVDVLDILLKRGADYKIENRWSFTPFHLAAKQVNLDMIKVFLDNNVDANIVNSRKETPLHVIGEIIFTTTNLGAADKDTYLKIINALVQKGANINFQDFTGNTPLHHAVMNESSKLVQALLQCNADPAIKNIHGDNILHLACRSQRADNCVQDILNSNVDIDAVNRDRDTALHMAIKRNDDNIVELILKKNPNIDMKNKIGYTALHQAVKSKRYCMVDLLLQNGANVDLQDAYGETALHLAIESRELSIVTLLLKNKTNVNLKASSGRTALHLAAELPKIPIEIIESILNSTDDIDAKDERGRTALHYAALYTDDRTLEMLLKAKADVNVKDSAGNTPLHLAISWENECVTRLESMQVLVNYRADVNAVNNYMRTPLHYACWIKHVEAMKYLIQNGADSSMRDRDGRTIFHYACMIEEDTYYDGKDFENLLHIFVEEEVSVNWVDKFGKTPLHYLVEEKNLRFFYLREVFLKIGADINIKDKNHSTVINTFLNKCGTIRYSNTKPFIEHVIKMKEIGMGVHEKTLNRYKKVNNQYDLQKIQFYESECRKEIDLMNTNIDQSDITYYNFLKMSPHKAMNYTCNENVVNAIKSDELLEVFPIYGNFLKCHLRYIQRRPNLYKKIQRFSKSSIFEMLLTDYMHEILQYLNNSDLDNFLVALKPVVLIK